MVLLTSITIFIILLGINYKLVHDTLYPPLLFTGTWLILLIGILFSGDSLYEIGVTTYLVYVVGALAFSSGGLLALASIPPARNGMQAYGDRISLPNVRRTLDVLILILIVGLPLYWRAVSSLADDDVEIQFLLQNIRRKTVELRDEGGAIGPIANLVVLAQFVALAAFYDSNRTIGGRLRTAIAIVLALIYGAMSGTKGNAVFLLLTLYFVYSLKIGEIRLRPLVVTVASALALFSLGLIFVNYAFTSFSDSSEIAVLLAETVQNYFLSGLVAFDRIVENPNVMESTQPIHRFFLETGRSLGLTVYVPPKHADYTDIAPYMDSNTYTIYFSYFKDYGWIGTIVIMTILGFGMTGLYRRIRNTEPVTVLLYAKLCVALVMSLHADHFFNGLNSHIKAVLFFVFIYHVVPSVRIGAIRSGRHA